MFSASLVTPMREIQRAFITTSLMLTLFIHIVDGVVVKAAPDSNSISWSDLLTKSSWAEGVPEDHDQALVWWEMIVVPIVFVLSLYYTRQCRAKATIKAGKCAPKPEKITGVYVGGKWTSTDSRLQGETRRDELEPDKVGANPNFAMPSTKYQGFDYGEADVAVLKAYTKLMSSCARGGQWEQAISLMEEMSAKGVKPDVICFSAAINACAKSRQIKQAFSLFRKMQTLGLRPDLVSYNALISACAKCGSHEGAVAAIEEMRKAGVRPDTITYNAAISACGNAGFANMALHFFEEMQAHGLEPDVITYSSVMDACSKGKMGERALEILDEMKARGVTPNLITYNTAFGACSRARLPDRVLELLREMVDNGIAPTHASFTIAISCLAKCGRFIDAVELLRMMRARGCNVQSLVKAYDSTIAICMECGNVDLALQLLRDLRKEGWIEDVGKYAAVVRAGARRGDIDDFEFDNLDLLKWERPGDGPPRQELPAEGRLDPKLPPWRKGTRS